MKLIYPGSTPSLGDPNEEQAVSRQFMALQMTLEEALSALVLFENLSALSAMPALSPYRDKLPFICAKAFIAPAHLAQRILETLSKTQPKIKVPLARLRAAVPGLESVRDSIQHTEDRLLGVRKGGKAISLKPISNTLVEAPNGAVIINGLNGNRYGITCADGKYREIEIGRATFLALLENTQAAIDSLSWKGPGSEREFPRPPRL